MFFSLIVAISCLCVFAGAQDVKNSNSLNGSVVSDNDEDAYYPYQDWSDTFDWQLLKVFADPKYKNVIISPISLKLVLALLYEGSSGSTEKEFQSVLHFPVQKQVVRENFYNILESLQPTERREYVLNLGTRIFMDSSIKPQQAFAAKAKYNYQTDIQLLDFANGTSAAASINSWVENITNGKISSLVSDDELKNAIMLIINTIFFKGSWRHEFPKNRTALGGFYVTPSDVVEVPLMKTTDKFFYYESNTLDAKILRLPYKGKRYAMFIVLPNSKGGLNSLLQKINLDSLKRNFYFMDYVPVEVTLPKLKFDFKVQFTHILEEFGLRQMFQNTASFPGIARGENNILRMLFVSDIIQKSGIQLDEEGSSVFSATDVVVSNKFGEVENVFNATHPFMFFIEEQTKGTILFAGKVENPLNIDSFATRFGGETGPTPNEVLHSIPINGSPLNLEPENAVINTVNRRFNYFDLELLQEFSEIDQNVFISPASIKTTLSMILEGAKGKCAQEIGNALRIEDINDVEIRKQLQRLLFDLNEKTPNNELTSANAVFVSNKLKILSDYHMKLAQHYRAQIKSVDLSNGPKAISEINEWVYNATKGHIPTIIGDNLFEDSTIVIANALYFRGKWKTSFNSKETLMKCFDIPNIGCKDVPMMQKTDSFNYNMLPYLNAHAVEVPYQDDKYSMLLLIPSAGTNIKILARDMQHAHFESILNSLKPTEIMLELPRFEIESEVNLMDYLIPLKIQEIFGPKANLSGIVENTNTRIGNIIHKAKIEVNEEGTKAAAATSAVVIPLMGETALRVSADKPFIFFIYQKESKNIIFEGIVLEPKNSEASPPSLSPTSKTVQTNKFVPKFGNRYVPNTHKVGRMPFATYR
ncbi:hypothetical protein WA026_004545 [Henosepilachna vigintioctopunctata]|uniref:Serpin domain-containing protein n=1 Tax=Henosepilachna vigintioctopunctata TaxID=420089 RepID=A0AAW1V8A0_9CUCU